MERIFGPVNGHYVATYACPMGELGTDYLGYARVCRTRPKSFWEASAMYEVIVSDMERTSDAALQSAYALAKRSFAEGPQ